MEEIIGKGADFFLKCFNDKVFTNEDKLKTIKILLNSFSNSEAFV